MKSDLEIEIEISHPGRTTGTYRTVDQEYLLLEKFFYPKNRRCFDRAIIIGAITEWGDPLEALLLGDVSHPVGTHIISRVIGGVCIESQAVLILAIAVQDQSLKSVLNFDDLPVSHHDAILKEVVQFSGSQPHMVTAEEVKQAIREAYIRNRKTSFEQRPRSNQAAWKPASMKRAPASYKEADHYTAAEYTFFQLPYHMQAYITEYLDKDERVLYAIRRPSMRSAVHRSWKGKEKLQEGVLLLTNQRLIQLRELIPLGGSHVRYGFKASLGVLERLCQVKMDLNFEANIQLLTTWCGNGGEDVMEWEAPVSSRSDILELLDYLEKFLPANTPPGSMMRASLPEPPEFLPGLWDPATNDPKDQLPIDTFFRTCLPRHLSENETVYAWALWPAWFMNRGYNRVLICTNQKVLVLSDGFEGGKVEFETGLSDICTIEYTGSILESSIQINFLLSGNNKSEVLFFPYPAESVFRRCFEAIRRCMAVVPVLVE